MHNIYPDHSRIYFRHKKISISCTYLSRCEDVGFQPPAATSIRTKALHKTSTNSFSNLGPLTSEIPEAGKNRKCFQCGLGLDANTGTGSEPCIDLEKICDGVHDCPITGSDEMHCAKISPPAPKVYVHRKFKFFLSTVFKEIKMLLQKRSVPPEVFRVSRKLTGLRLVFH